MALGSTIYKFNINISDLNRNVYETLALTVAQHPSENVPRMMARVLAYCLHYEEYLAFTKGLSTPETPDIWAKTLDGQTRLWIEVGEPSFDKLKKATRVASEVWVYSFNNKSSVWWQQEQSKMAALKLCVRRFEWNDIEQLSTMIQRSMDMSITISEDSVFIAGEKGECEIHWQELQARL